MDRYAVVGNPIAHSLSPHIHTMFAKQTHQDLCYDAILAPIEGFIDTVKKFQSEGGKGLNVTLPFKVEAQTLVNECSARARRAGAVNTIVFRQNGSLFGDNTDGIGLLRDLRNNHHLAIEGSYILILGAGGAVRGVLEPLLSIRPAQVVIANRTVNRAIALCEAFQNLGEIQPCGFDELHNKQFDLIINGTSASVSGEIPSIPDNVLATDGSCYDMFYSHHPTAFVKWGIEHNAKKSVDGIGMLVEQAAESFFIWRGVRPETRPVIDQLSGSI